MSARSDLDVFVNYHIKEKYRVLLIYNDSKGGKFHWSRRTSIDFLRHVLSVFSTSFFLPKPAPSCCSLQHLVSCTDTPCTCNIQPAEYFKGKEVYLSPCLTLCLSLVYYSICIPLQFLLELGPQRGIICKTWSCHLLRAYNFLILPIY